MTILKIFWRFLMSIFTPAGSFMAESNRPSFDACKIAQTTLAIAGSNSDPFIAWALTMAFVSHSGGLWRWEEDLGGGEIYRFDLSLTNAGWFAELTQDVNDVMENYQQWRGAPAGKIACVGGAITFTDGGITFDGMRVELVTV